MSRDSSFNDDLFFCADGKRGLLQKAAAPPGSASPLEFDAYTLNHAAFVGTQETAWVTDFEQELTRRGVFVVKGKTKNITFCLFEICSVDTYRKTN
jgi:hypothetical protein